jgi:transketolase
VTLIANGLMVAAALQAAALLSQEGIEARVLDMHTVKPLDREAVERAARETGALVVAEEHLHHGGLGSVVASAAAETVPVPIRFVDLGDRFAESGPGNGLLEKYGLTATDVANATREAMAAKG